MKLLVVDGDTAHRALVCGCLAGAGFGPLQEADTCEAARRCLGVENPATERPPIDLILCALNLPDSKGSEAIRSLKLIDAVRDIPVIAIWDGADGDLIETLTEYGAADFIRQPIEGAELVARVRAGLKAREEIEARRAREKEVIELHRLLLEANRSLQRLSAIDGLTGIANRRHLDVALDREWRRATRGPAPLSAVMIDVDCLATYNELYGREAGDDLLARLSRALSGTLNRPGDVVGRYGGEEFLAILPDTPVHGAVAIAEVMRATIESLAIPHGKSSVSAHVTVSIGVSSTLPALGATATNLIAAADHALFQAKKAGRNRVVVQVLD